MSAPQQLLASMDGRIIYPIRETFEGNNDSGNGHGIPYFDMPGWTTSSGNVRPNYATAPAPLQGSRSAFPFNAYLRRGFNFSTASEIWSYAMINRQGALPNGSNFGGSGCYWRGDGAGGLQVTNGAVVGTAAFPLVIGTTYHAWCRFVPAASNSITQLFISTDGIRPATPYSEVLTGTNNTKNGNCDMSGPNQSGAAAMIFDCLLFAPFEIGNNPIT